MELRERAEEIFAWGLAQRTDDLAEGWKIHSFSAAKIASTIAEKAGMDADKAYAMGLLHDIGRYDVGARMDHIYLGYEKLMEEGLPQIARICLTHSFHPKETVKTLNLPSGQKNSDYVRDFVMNAEYDDYDRLIQLTDYMSGIHGVTLIERRFCSVLYRHGMAKPRAEIIELFNLKRHFDELCGCDIYTLFKEEISEAPFRGQPGSFGRIENDGNLKVEEVKEAQ